MKESSSKDAEGWFQPVLNIHTLPALNLLFNPVAKRPFLGRKNYWASICPTDYAYD